MGLNPTIVREGDVAQSERVPPVQGIAKLGIALHLECRDRWFKSNYPDWPTERRKLNTPSRQNAA